MGLKLEKHEPLVGAVGNILTWYNFALFMPLLHVISKKFFPTEDPSIGKILSFLAVSVGLFSRPLGAVIFGPIGDRFGRQIAISLSIWLMAIPTLLIAFLPDYHSIGIMAPIALIILRALQGVSMGGEYTTAMVHLVENAPHNRRGFFGCWTDAGSQIGTLLGCQALMILHYYFSEDDIYSFAWRIPFLFSVLLIPFAFTHKNTDTPKNKKNQKDLKIFHALAEHKKEVFCTIAITAFSSIAFYTLLTFLPFYLVSQNILSLRDATLCSTAANISIIVVTLFVGFISDYYKRKPFLTCGIIGVSISSFVMFTCKNDTFSGWLLIHVIYGSSLAVYYSCRAAFFAEVFPANVRCTAVSVSVSSSIAVFGGLSPVVLGILTDDGMNMLSILPIMVVSIIALYSLTLLKDRTGQKLL